MGELDETLAMREGGWDPRYARILAVKASGDVGAALVDANGDGADINLDLYERGPAGEWREMSSSGGAGDEGSSASSEMVAAYGHVDPGQVVHLDYGGEPHTVTASDDGWWLFVTPSVDEESLPEVRYDRMRADRAR